MLLHPGQGIHRPHGGGAASTSASRGLAARRPANLLAGTLGAVMRLNPTQRETGRALAAARSMLDELRAAPFRAGEPIARGGGRPPRLCCRRRWRPSRASPLSRTSLPPRRTPRGSPEEL